MIKIIILSLFLVSCNEESFEDKVTSEYEKLEPQIHQCKSAIDKIAKHLEDRPTYIDNSGPYFKTVNSDLDLTIKRLKDFQLDKLRLSDEWEFNKLLLNNCSSKNFKYFFENIKELSFCSGGLFELLTYYRAVASDLVEKKGTARQVSIFKKKLLLQIEKITTRKGSFLEHLIALNFLQTLQKMSLIGLKHKKNIDYLVKKYDAISASLGKRRLYSLVDMNEKQFNEACSVFEKLYQTENKYAQQVALSINQILKDIKSKSKLDFTIINLKGNQVEIDHLDTPLFLIVYAKTPTHNAYKIQQKTIDSFDEDFYSKQNLSLVSSFPRGTNISGLSGSFLKDIGHLKFEGDFQVTLVDREGIVIKTSSSPLSLNNIKDAFLNK